MIITSQFLQCIIHTQGTCLDCYQSAKMCLLHELHALLIVIRIAKMNKLVDLLPKKKIYIYIYQC